MSCSDPAPAAAGSCPPSAALCSDPPFCGSPPFCCCPFACCGAFSFPEALHVSGSLAGLIETSLLLTSPSALALAFLSAVRAAALESACEPKPGGKSSVEEQRVGRSVLTGPSGACWVDGGCLCREVLHRNRRQSSWCQFSGKMWTLIWLPVLTCRSI